MLPDWLLQTLNRAWTALEPLGLPMAVMGGVAVSKWQHYRATKDSDILLALTHGGTDEIIQAVRGAGFRFKRDPPVIPIGDVDLIQAFYEPPGLLFDVRVDLLVAKGGYHRHALDRRVSAGFTQLNRNIQVVACEDLVLLKLLAGRVIDLADAAMVIRENRDLMDVTYLTQWADSLELSPDLEQVWDEAFPGEKPPDPKTK